VYPYWKSLHSHYNGMNFWTYISWHWVLHTLYLVSLAALCTNS
jgi:hypothetical protein